MSLKSILFQKSICIILFLFLVNLCFSQASEDFFSTSSLYYSDIPLKEGVSEFEEKLAKIREDENREPLGLVLCGGSARAFAHIGVLKSLEENGIVPDFIVANSMGAIIGQLYAYGFSLDSIVEIISEIDLTSYFDPVIPIHGGVINTRKFRALINELLGEEQVDISQCEIPILVITEDLISKRQVWHCSGDFATVMSAAFSMPAIMETVSYELQENDNIPVCLTDSGTIDIAGISVAESFSNNIIVSTAFYDKKINLDNFIVVLNRVMAIGKERQTVKDIKKYEPLIIRNQVENFSFMEFDKVEELLEIGYETTNNLLETIQSLPHGNRDFSEKRKYTDSLIEKLKYKIENDIPLKKNENYFGGKIRATFANIDYPDFSLFETDGLSFLIFGETKQFYGKVGLTLPFDSWRPTPEVFLQYNPNEYFNLSLYGAYGKEFFAGANLDIKRLFFTAEFLGDDKITSKNILFSYGINIDFGHEKSNYLEVSPFGFISGLKFVDLSYGFGSKMQTQCVIKNFGISDDISFRYALKDGNTRLYKSDNFRDKKSVRENKTVFSNGFEIFYKNTDEAFSFAELFILKEYKFGGFFDLAYTGAYEFCTGGFGRVNLSFIGLCDFVIESGLGYNLTNKNIFGYFTLKNRI